MLPATRVSPQRGAFCPVCERFIGPAEICPYCEEDSAGKGMLKGLRRAALLLGLIGLALLYTAASRREIPLIRISEIRPAMNFAHVRISGRVARKPHVSEKRGTVDYISFPVADRTGEIRVAAYRETARALVRLHGIPVKDSWVEVTGNLSVSAGGQTRLRIYDADRFRVGSAWEAQ